MTQDWLSTILTWTYGREVVPVTVLIAK